MKPRRQAGRIFISYLSHDTAYPAGWLYDRLADRYGKDRIFKGVDSIDLGDDSVKSLTDAVATCKVVLALIGPNWLSAMNSHPERPEDNPANIVRLEIEAALARDVVLIPVLVDGAKLPPADALPSSLAPMIRRQALELSSDGFGADADVLLKHVSKIVRPTRVRRAVAASGVLLVCAAVALSVMFLTNREPPAMVKCWNGTTVKEDTSCPQMKGLAAFNWAYAWDLEESKEPRCQNVEVTSDGEVEAFACSWNDLGKSGSRIIFERWPDVKTAKRYFDAAVSTPSDEFLVFNEDGTFDDVGWTWVGRLGEQEGGEQAVVRYRLYDDLPLSVSSFGVGQTLKEAVKNRDSMEDRFQSRTSTEIAAMLKTLKR